MAMGRGIGEREGGRGPKFSFSQCPVCVATPKGHLVKGGPSYQSLPEQHWWAGCLESNAADGQSQNAFFLSREPCLRKVCLPNQGVAGGEL